MNPAISSPARLALCALILLAVPPPELPGAEALDGPDGPGGSSSFRAGCPVPDDATLEREGAVIGEILIQVGDIFDPETAEENGKVYRLVNRLHTTTRPSVVEDLLLFASGDPYSRRVLEESERLLRAERFLYDAAVRPVRYCGGRVDVEVWVRDVWTLQLSASYRRAGGVGGSRFEAQDVNFLGTGKDLTVAHTEEIDRTRLLTRYRDPNVMGRRVQLEAVYADADDGILRVFDLKRPFYALDTRWSAGLRVRLDERVDDLYTRGRVAGSFGHEQDFVELSGGVSRGLEDGRVLRWRFGATYLADRFGPPPSDRTLGRRPAFPADPGLFPIAFRSPLDLRAPPPPVPAGPPPPDRTLAYPWVGFDWVEDDFEEVHNFDQLARTEDLYLGRRVSGRLGWSSEAFGGDGERAVFDLAVRDGAALGGGLLMWSAQAGGRWGDDGAENLLAGIWARYYRRTFGEHLFLVEAGGDLARDLDPERQLLLGGDSGLRGYPLRYQEGDRRFLLTLEQRFYTPWHLFHVLHVGAAVFADVGRAWFPDGTGEAGGAGGGLLKDLGFGLRLASSRSGRGTLVHLDVAFPLDGDPSIERVQWLVTTKETF